MKKVELLAPAGSYESFLGAIHAGADAVYLGGNKFGARAYAGNFTEEEIYTAIKVAHVYGRKVYLTVNTLVKEVEFGQIDEFLRPLYLAGLDAVIVQDMGVFQAVGRLFPELERHVSTQMSITGAYGAAYVKGLGATRIVPARELTLKEIKEIKEKVDIEIEAFIHGAVCYCYSGQCLFSSMLGGRSGNRGRCAQPCRLPYQISLSADERKSGREAEYPLSLKDMCTIDMIPELIGAGIDSFKIEGRMKSPEYAAGVTALYRKYIDRYYAGESLGYLVDKEDKERLCALYIRSEISEGYYHKHNGRDMITMKDPGYAGRDGRLAGQIHEQYVQGDYRLSAYGAVHLYKSKRALFTVGCDGVTVSVEGDVLEAAKNQPLTEEKVKKQLMKSGTAVFRFDKLDIFMEPDTFMPVKSLNDLRRIACGELCEKLVEKNGLSYPSRQEEKGAAVLPPERLTSPETVAGEHSETGTKSSVVHASVLNEGQLRAVLKSKTERIYISSDLLTVRDNLPEVLKDSRQGQSYYLAMPYILREKDDGFLKKVEKLLKGELFDGVLIRNQEQLQWLKSITYSKGIVSDANLYMWNREAYDVYSKECAESYLPYELNMKEIMTLIRAAGVDRFSLTAYGRIPMMVTANCVARTAGSCIKEKRTGEKECLAILTDRYRKEFPVYLNCIHCYNIIYNSVPLSLHQSLMKLRKEGLSVFRLDFTDESEEMTGRVIAFYERQLAGYGMTGETPPFPEYTNGHLKRGVE